MELVRQLTVQQQLVLIPGNINNYIIDATITDFLLNFNLNWQKFNLELDNEIRKYHEEIDKKVKKPKIIEKGTFGEDGWSISIGNVEDGNTKD